MKRVLMVMVTMAVAVGCNTPARVTTTEPKAVKRTPEKPEERPDETCESDDGCVLVQADCCSCRSGGSRIALAREAAEAHTAKLEATCADQICPTVMSGDPSCIGEVEAVCREGRCVLKTEMP